MQQRFINQEEYIPITSRLFYRRQVDFCCQNCRHYEKDVGMLTPHKIKNKIKVLCEYCRGRL